ncbi:MAG: hypothetical protein J6X61_00300 [Clostridia bacterium]|nr:hypothetical protein [Clostridia bacterium]
MKRVSLKTQKILVFIPLVNGLILFIWLFNFSRTYTKWSVFGKSLLLLLVFGLAVGLTGYLSATFLPQAVNDVLWRLNAYLIPFALGWLLIAYQSHTIFQE